VKKLLSRVVLGVVAGMAIYVGLSVWKGANAVGHALGAFRWSAALVALLCASINYLLRYGRWHYYLKVLGLRQVRAGESLLVFLAGFSLTVTPGKLGEAVKGLLLRESHGIPAARTSPIVITERLTDLIGLLALAAIGAAQLAPNLRRFLVVGAALVVAGLVVIAVPALANAALALAAKLPGIKGLAPKLREAHEATAATLTPAPLAVGIALSVAAWFFECLAFWVVVGGFPGASVPLFDATWIYAAMTVIGALSFLPGGLGLSEAVMLELLERFGHGTGGAVATAATFVTRLCTLWFAVALGLGALLLFARRKHIHVELPAKQHAA
jgi:uncharacterized protein (TIRG00374 family)